MVPNSCSAFVFANNSRGSLFHVRVRLLFKRYNVKQNYFLKFFISCMI